MSYDLTLFRPVEGVDPKLTYESLVEQDELESGEKQPISELVWSQMQQVADALRSRHPAFEQFQPNSPLPWIELDDEGLQVQANIRERAVGITMPYFRKDAEEMVTCVCDCVEVLNQGFGYIAYDPQLDHFVSAIDLADMIATYRGMDRALPGILAQSARSSAQRKKPWWKIW